MGLDFGVWDFGPDEERERKPFETRMERTPRVRAIRCSNMSPTVACDNPHTGHVSGAEGGGFPSGPRPVFDAVLVAARVACVAAPHKPAKLDRQASST